MKISKKKSIITCTIIFLLIFSNYTINLTQASIAYEKNPKNNFEGKTNWSTENEGDHYPTGSEWWTFHAALELEDGSKWDASTTFQYNLFTSDESSFYITSHLFYFFNRDNDKCYDFTSYNTNKMPISFEKNELDLKYHNCTVKGLYPDYDIHLEDSNKDFLIDMKFCSTSMPHWVFEDYSNGYFPWGGKGIARYYYVLRLDVIGNITINGVKYKAKGVGYYEHAWGDFSYGMRGEGFKNLKNTIKHLPDLFGLLRYFYSEKYGNPSTKLKFSIDNFFGYDWGWAALDNGWSFNFGVFYPVYWLSKKYEPGMLSLSKDGKNFIDFANLKIKYIKSMYLEEADVNLPYSVEITANKDDKKLFLKLDITTESALLYNIYPYSRYSCGAGGHHSCGEIQGYYTDKNGKISLNGICMLTPYRQFICKNHDYEITKHDSEKSYFNKDKFSSQSNVLYVGGCGQNNYSKIQDAIDDAKIGDTVFVYNGTYHENLDISRSIRLIGENKDLVILKIGDRDGIKIKSKNVEISGFTIDGENKSSRWNIQSIDVKSSGNYIHNNSIVNSDWYGIYIDNSSKNIIENNIFINNDIGIWLCRSNKNRIKNNLIKNSKWTGIWFYPFSEENVICNNNFIENNIHALNPDRFYKQEFDKNYWDDYIGLKFKRLFDLNRDGIGLLPYNFYKLNFDRHPKINPYDF